MGGAARDRSGHLTPVSERPKWIIDYLKPECVPVAVWWTYDRGPVEFDWATVLGAMPGASCPARTFGANDNRGAESHLVRFASPPSFEAFQKGVKSMLPGHARLHRVAVENWTGAGWPEYPRCQSSRRSSRRVAGPG